MFLPVMKQDANISPRFRYAKDIWPFLLPVIPKEKKIKEGEREGRKSTKPTLKKD